MAKNRDRKSPSIVPKKTEIREVPSRYGGYIPEDPPRDPGRGSDVKINPDDPKQDDKSKE